jgi:hypothetical protein
VDWSAPKISLLKEEMIACFISKSYVSRAFLSIPIIVESLWNVGCDGRKRIAPSFGKRPKAKIKDV